MQRIANPWTSVRLRDAPPFSSVAGWSSLVARRAHNPKVVGSNPAPATIFHIDLSGGVLHNPQAVAAWLAVNPAPATTFLRLATRLVENATLAQLVERNLAKVEVTSSNLVCRSKLTAFIELYRWHPDAGWSSLVARRAHNPKVVGSNPAPATIFHVDLSGGDIHNPQAVAAWLAVNPAPATIFLRLATRLVENATLAQLVERNLAKVEVTSSNLVCRSKLLAFIELYR